MTARRALALATLLTALSGCRQSRCEDLESVPVAGDYRGGGSLGGERLLNVALTARGKDVELRYVTRDGSRIRAKYKVARKLKMKP